MEWIVSDKSTATRIVESVTLSQFKQWLHEKKCKCKIVVSHCDPYFLLTKEQRRNLTGPIGPAGCMGAVGPVGSRTADIKGWEESRPIAEIERLCVTIEFTMSNEKAEEIKSHKLVVTPNETGDTIPTWQIINIPEYAYYACGVYKRDGFNDAYNAIKRLKPNITEQQFAKNFHYDCENSNDIDDEWDKDLVDIKLYNGNSDCLMTGLKCDNIKSAKSRVRMTLRAIDLDKNLEYIKTILSAYKST